MKLNEKLDTIIPGELSNPHLYQEAADVSTKTIETLNKHGRCYWRCRQLDDEIIMVVLCPPGPADARYPVYTVDELPLLAELPLRLARYINNVKKVTAAEIFLK